MQGASDTSEAGGTEPERIGTSLWRGPVPWLIACGTLLIAAIVVGTIVMASGFRARTIANNERELENTVLLLSRHFAQQFEDAETAVSHAIRRMQLGPISSPEAFRSRMAQPDIREMLQSQVNGLSYMGDLTIIDADGNFVNWSSNDPLPGINVTDRSYFRDLQSTSQPDAFVILPVVSRVTSGWATIVAHRLSGANGQFLGLLTRRVDPHTYEMFLESMALGKGASITLFHTDGAVLARYPHIESLMGARIGDDELLKGVPDNGAGTSLLTSPVDNLEKIAASARIGRFPLIVSANRAVDDALADWRSQMVLLVAAAMLAVLVIAVMFSLMIRQIVRQNRIARRQLEAEKQRVETALDNMTLGLISFDADARVAMFNQRFIDLLGLSSDVIKPGIHLGEVVAHCKARGAFDGDVTDFCADVLDRANAGGTSQMVAEGSRGRFFNVIDKPLASGGWVTTIEDISERRRLEQERDRNHAFLRTIIDHIPSHIMVKDVRDRRYVLVNQSTEQRFGMPRDEIVGKTAFDLLPRSTAEKVTADDDRALEQSDGLFLGEHPWQTPALGLRYITSRRITVADEAHRPRYLINVIEDTTERRLADEKIAHLAHFDALTELPNRVLFRERIDEELERARHGTFFALLYIDVDEFKGINDSLGHHVGDELLKTIARRIESCLGPEDMVARLGGDEFAVLLTTVADQDEVIVTVTKILETIRQPYRCLGHQLSTDASIGIALAPRDGVERDQVTKHADLAMYAAKAGGRRTFRFFEPSMDESARARLQLQQDLRRAIAESEFELHYQPLLGFTQNIMTGCEALLRWRHPERGMVPPLDFIPLAEDTGLINEIGDWVMRTACAEAASWPSDIRIAVNVSPVQLKSPTLALRIAGALSAAGLAPERLEIEITEAVLISDDDVALSVLHQLHDMGVRIALDDFGTGYSSLSYLKRFPFDKIKIDRCFVSDLGAGSSSAIVQAVVSIAAASNMTTTAEGVETGAQQSALRQLGCTEMQGYLFSAPKPAAELRKLFAREAAAKEDLQAAG
ncbi:GGDEF domain-containing protein [Bradyrhizobium sp. SSBR45G]|uniref:bifunctional diguanylate cyclase/phosphodiesterase n=1 Tax=unclassified Bradyrhizobium TaxID=2631580 RepID=UPI00234290DE|nr:MULTISPECIES: EAL domain-containing protein [unclassified Bradyrhizobium]GLH78101.1 GGDEF domain-containing protein [Bradyrhizobium sp. SSBR45G]GLH87999.1 GGDEF domain-containing protein [Bradyrhizobium sp. SSBR45R]